MSDRVVWSNNTTFDYLNSMDDDTLKANLVDYGYEREMLDQLSEEELKDLLEKDNDFIFSQIDSEEFDYKVAPMINKQTFNGIVLAVGDNLTNSDNYYGGRALTVDDLKGGDILDFKYIEIRDDGAGLVFVGNNGTDSRVAKLYAIPENDLRSFVENLLGDAIEETRELYYDDYDLELDDGVYDKLINEVIENIDVSMLNHYLSFSKVPRYCERIKNELNESLNKEDINEASTKEPKKLAKEIKEIKKLANDYGREYFTSMPFTAYDNDPTSIEYNYPEFFRIVKLFFKEMGILSPEELADTDVLDMSWDQDISQHDWDVIIRTCEKLVNKPGSTVQIEKEYKTGYNSYLDDDQILADRETDNFEESLNEDTNLGTLNAKKFINEIKEKDEDDILKYEEEIEDGKPHIEISTFLGNWAECIFENDGSIVYEDDITNDRYDNGEIDNKYIVYKDYNEFIKEMRKGWLNFTGEENEESLNEEDYRWDPYKVYKIDKHTGVQRGEWSIHSMLQSMKSSDGWALNLAKTEYNDIENWLKEYSSNRYKLNDTINYKGYNIYLAGPEEDYTRECFVASEDGRIKQFIYVEDAKNYIDITKAFVDGILNYDENFKTIYKNLLHNTKKIFGNRLKWVKYYNESKSINASELEDIKDKSLKEGANEELAMHELKDQVTDYIYEFYLRSFDDNIAIAVQASVPGYNADWCNEDGDNFVANSVESAKKALARKITDALFENAPRELQMKESLNEDVISNKKIIEEKDPGLIISSNPDIIGFEGGDGTTRYVSYRSIDKSIPYSQLYDWGSNVESKFGDKLRKLKGNDPIGMALDDESLNKSKIEYIFADSRKEATNIVIRLKNDPTVEFIDWDEFEEEDDEGFPVTRYEITYREKVDESLDDYIVDENLNEDSNELSAADFGVSDLELDELIKTLKDMHRNNNLKSEPYKPFAKSEKIKGYGLIDAYDEIAKVSPELADYLLKKVTSPNVSVDTIRDMGSRSFIGTQFALHIKDMIDDLENLKD